MSLPALPQVTLLWVASNPLDTTHLRLDKEYEVLKNALAGGPRRLVPKDLWAATPENLLRALTDARPAVVHFALHGEDGGELRFDDGQGNTRLLGAGPLASVFAAVNKPGRVVRCVVLNGCHSDRVARALCKHVEAVIGSTGSIADEASLAFTQGFYTGLAAGLSVGHAVQHGKAQIDMIPKPDPKPGKGEPDPFSPENIRARRRRGLDLDALDLFQPLPTAGAVTGAPARPGPSPPPSPGAANPYDPWTPVTPPRFVGREGVVRRLEAALEEGRSISLVGDARVGKSSVLATWAQRLAGSGRTVRYVTGEGPEGASVGAFVAALTGEAAVPADPDGAMNVLSRWVAAVTRPGLLPVVLVDEVDGLLPRFDPRLFERLRGMLGRLALVLASRRELDVLYRQMHRTSPFHNRLQLEWLGLLEPEAAERLIGQGRDFLRPEDAETLHQWAGRHPFFLQLLGHHLVDARRQGEPAAEAVDRFQAEAAVRFRELWRTLDGRERQALRDSVAGTPVEVAGLRRRGLVTAEGQPFGRALADWLREARP
jgi:hypothetical protein